MTTLVWGTAVFLLGLLIQLAWWRAKLPARQTLALLFIQGTGTALAALRFNSCSCSGSLTLLGVTAPRGGAETAHFTLYMTALTLAWMITWSAVEADSPSLVIMRRVRGAGQAGIPHETLSRELDGTVLFAPRLKDLLTDRMAVLQNGRYRLTAKGVRMARFIMFWRKLMNMGKGG